MLVALTKPVPVFTMLKAKTARNEIGCLFYARQKVLTLHGALTVAPSRCGKHSMLT
jgi:hypothetical protein